MKIVNLEKFLSLPKDVVYAKFEPNLFGAVTIKADTSSSSGDWWYQDLLEVYVKDNEEWDTILSKAVEKGVSFDLDYESIGRDGLYEKNQLFAVFEKKDVVALIERLKKTLSDYPEI
ncbi:hypothetical protein ACOMCU_01680 [Lysinibacillus sp. UGB7]|uniref:hypothetical protein n=1 Tax=Lysinibacillus sp. UGB7 TaxID=3411039 RepID=UPI003B80233C